MNWMKYKTIYFALSLLVIIPGVYSLARFGLKLAIDFTGGSTLQLKSNPQDKELIINTVEEKTDVLSSQQEGDTLTLNLPPIDQNQVTQITESLKEKSVSVEATSFFTVGPSIGQELIRKTLAAVALATVVILFFVARAFKSLVFGVSAILAMLHDTLIVIGSFSLLGHFFGVAVDLLFVTAVLTILSFSVHDTIVVYDRVRELKRKHSQQSLEHIANSAVTETLIRSLNNSLTIIFMLLALVLLGGETIRWFALALLIGTITGTYSSTFTATPLLIVLDKLINKRKK